MEVKKCPYCAEEILADAKKCKHCGEFLDSTLRPQHNPPEQKIVVENKSSGLLTFFLVLGVIFLLIAIFGF